MVAGQRRDGKKNDLNNYVRFAIAQLRVLGIDPTGVSLSEFKDILRVLVAGNGNFAGWCANGGRDSGVRRQGVDASQYRPVHLGDLVARKLAELKAAKNG